MTVCKKEYAIRKASERFDVWRDHWNVIPRFGSYYGEGLAQVETSVIIGIRVALGLRIRFKDGELIDDDTVHSGRVQITDKDAYAVCKATESFDEWMRATGCVNEGTPAYDDLLAVMIDAARIGFRVASDLQIRFGKKKGCTLILDNARDFGDHGLPPLKDDQTQGLPKKLGRPRKGEKR